MEDKVLTERDVHPIVKILQKSSTLITSMHLICGALGLTHAEHLTISRRVNQEGWDSYHYLTLVVNKWIELNGSGASVKRLARILRDENFKATADEVLKTLEKATQSTLNDTAVNEPGIGQVELKASGNEIEPIPSGMEEKEKPVTQQSTSTFSVPSKSPSGMNCIEPSPILMTRNADPKPELLKTPQLPEQSTSNKTKGNVATFVKLFDNVENIQSSKLSRVNVGSEGVKETMSSTGICDKLERVDLSDVQNGQLSSSNEIVELKGSQVEFNSFLKMGRQNYNALKSIQFKNIEMSWGVFWDSVNWIDFWNCVDNFKTLESIELINMKNLRFVPAKRVLLPNLRRYALKLDWISSNDIMSALEQSRKSHGEVNYLVEYLIPFKRGNLVEDIWSTCFSLECVRLDLTISSDVTFRIDRDHFEFHVDRSYVEYHQNSNETQCSVLPQFLQSFQGLKKLTLTNKCGIKGYIDFSSFPSSLTHFRLIDSPTSIRDGDLDVVLKTCRELVYLDVCDPVFSTIIKHTLNLANLSPKIRCLILYNTSITRSSSCEFNQLSVLRLYDSHFQSSVNVPIIFRNVKKCYFGGPGRPSDPIFTGLKNWLEMDSLEFIVIEGFKIDKKNEVRRILKSYGVPRIAERFALQRNGKKQWVFVSDREKNPWKTFNQALTQAWERHT